MSNYFKAITSDSNGNPSSKRFILVIAGCCMSLATLVLAGAAVVGVDVEGALWAITGPLSGMAGASYVGGKMAERKGSPSAPTGD